MFWWIFALITGVKLLLIPSYRSTDFEVHRNWLAITHSLPLSKWYFEETSLWTLDYPPFFAYFEWILSCFAKFVDPRMLDVKYLGYDSTGTVLFQRISVIVTDVVFAIAVKRCIEALSPKSSLRFVAGSVFLLCNVGLIFVDHIHFQYNGFLFGIFLMSIACLLENKHIQCVLWFSVLLNLKHIFLYVAPALGAYLLKFHCFNSSSFFRNFFSLLAVAGMCIATSFGPFWNHLPQVFSRLFPFKRGLTHSYWAPNFWALYNFGDKVLSVVLKNSQAAASNTGGLVQQYDHAVLYSVSPLATFVLTALFMLPCVIKILFFTEKSQSKESCLRAIVVCSLTSFMFGWHVHEKAILMAIIPLGILSLISKRDGEKFLFLSIIGHYSLFPLLFPKELILIKYSLYLAYQLAVDYFLRKIHPDFSQSIYKKIYISGFAILTFYEYVGQYLLGLDVKMQFLPLLLISVYCSLGNMFFYVQYYYEFMLTTKKHSKTKLN